MSDESLTQKEKRDKKARYMREYYARLRERAKVIPATYPAEKKCVGCDLILPGSEFSPNGPGVLRSRCKKCAAAVHREGRDKNSEKYRAWGRASHAKHADQRRAEARDRYYANRENRIAKVREYAAQNADLIKARRAAERKSNPQKFRDWNKRDRAKHAEDIAERARAKYAALTPEQRTEIARKQYEKDREKAIQRARARDANLVGTFTKTDVQNLHEQQRGLCNSCGVEFNGKFEIDHVIPLKPRDGSAPGTNTVDNLQLLCKPCNRSKSNLTPEQWAMKKEKRC
jgi:5-methylcytosine-specific restriction endonuclease McrA